MIPNEIEALRGLLHLNISGNKLASLSASIGYLSNLKYLNVDGNRIQILPPYVIVAYSQVTLPAKSSSWLSDLLRCRSLTVLSANRNMIASLPEGIRELTSLEILLLNANRLEQIPDSIGDLPALRVCVSWKWLDLHVGSSHMRTELGSTLQFAQSSALDPGSDLHARSSCTSSSLPRSSC
jgi:Leucine-rich repeat (LRR) protein